MRLIINIEMNGRLTRVYSLLLLSIVVFNEGNCTKVYDWERQWSSDVVTQEFASVDTDRRVIIHSSTHDVSGNTPAISLHDYNFSATEFPDGIVAIRPLLSAVNQVCLITTSTRAWRSANKNTRNRHRTVIDKDEVNKYVLESSIPGDLDHKTIENIADFCNVDARFVFHIQPVDSLSGYKKKLKIQGLFVRYNIGVPNQYQETVYAATWTVLY